MVKLGAFATAPSQANPTQTGRRHRSPVVGLNEQVVPLGIGLGLFVEDWAGRFHSVP